MKIKISDLQKIQNELDSRIFEKHNTTRQETRNDRILALLVEAGELANETRCFKYWSVKTASDKSLIFEEFSDVLHFSLSLGIDIDFDEDIIEYDESELSLNEQFMLLFERIHHFQKFNSKDSYVDLMQTVFELAHSLGMDESMIREMYLMKNEKNHQRQDNNY